MTIEDIDITFGKSVLIEKSCKNIFDKIIKIFCKDIPGSFLHCIVNGTQSITIIRYAQLADSDLCAVRILYFKPCETTHPSTLPFYITEEHGFENLIRTILKTYSTGDRVLNTYFNDLCMSDSRLIVCHKESLSEIIVKMIENIKFSLSIHPVPTYSPVVINSPFIRPSILNDCNFLYGHNGEEYKFMIPRVLSMTDSKILQHDINIWRNKLKRKGRRLLLKSITLEPI